MGYVQFVDRLQGLHYLPKERKQHVGLEGLREVDGRVKAVVLRKVDDHELVRQINFLVVVGVIIELEVGFLQ